MSDPTSPSSTVAWPANHRAALSIIVNVQSPFGGDEAGCGPTGLDYTATGLQRLLVTLADLDLPATLASTPQALDAFPQLIRTAVDQGAELAINLAGVTDTPFDESTLSQFTPSPVVGVIEGLPGVSARTPERSTLSALEWKITGSGGDFPIRVGAGDGTVLIPVSPYWIDATWLDPVRPLPPSSFLELWSLSLADIRTIGGHMTVILHPAIAGRPGIANQVVRFLDEVIESGDVWIASPGQVARWWSQESS
jgi:peptidoglycan/xylan/chitin deacetylase (PgdA/CDA1 family)